MKNLTNKVKQSQTAVIKRSQVKLADYNPRTISREARDGLKRNLRKNGLIGGIVFNEQTGNLVSGHQRVSIMDEINKYDEGNNYDIKVEIVNVDAKTEKEMNLFFNSKAMQGEFDYAKLANMLPDIDTALAGLDDIDISMAQVEVPQMDYEVPTFEPQGLKREEAEEEMTEEEKIAHVKKIKGEVKEGSVFEGDPYFTVSFDSFENKAQFCEMYGLDPVSRFIKGEDFAEALEG